MALYVGKFFETADVAETCVTEFCRKFFHPIRRRTYTTLANYNRRLSEKFKLPDSVKYFQMHWICKHFGQYKSRGTDKKKVQHVLAKGCKFEIIITYNRSLQKFIVTKANLEHLNHEISPEIYSMYFDHRMPNPERMIEVDNMLKNNVNLMLIANILHSEGSQVRIKDLYNRKRKLIKIQEAIKPIDESLSSVLSKPEIIYEMMSGSDKMFKVLYFQTTKQQKMFSDYKEVVQIDASYKNPDLHYSLYTLLVEDKNGLGQPIAFGLLEKPDQAHIEQFLEFFMKQNETNGIQCFVIDKDQAEINAIENFFPNIPINIYYFHVLKAVSNYLSSYEDPKNKKTCLHQFNLVLKSKTPEEFYERLQAIKSISLTFHEYIIQNWLPFQQNIINFCDSNLMNLQNPNNSRLKPFHNLLKKVLGSVHLPLNEFLRFLLKIVDDLSLESLHKQFDMNMKSLVFTRNVVEYYNHFTDYAVALISKEIKKMNTIKYSIYSIINNQWTVIHDKSSYIVEEMKCSCGMPTQMGLPCQHLFAVWNDNGEPLFQPNSVAPRWKKENGVNLLNSFSNMPSGDVEAEEFCNISEGQSYLSHTSGDLIRSSSRISYVKPPSQPNLIIKRLKKETASTIVSNNQGLSPEISHKTNFSDDICKVSRSVSSRSISRVVSSTSSKKSKSSKRLNKLSRVSSKVKLKKSNGGKIQKLNNTMDNLKDLASIIVIQPTCNFSLMMAVVDKFKTLISSGVPNIVNLELQDLIDKNEKIKKMTE